MKAVILAGGHGTRLAEETDVKPKPMVEIGGRPILWHIMQIYSCYGVREFIRRRKPDATRPVPPQLLAEMSGADAILSSTGD